MSDIRLGNIEPALGEPNMLSIVGSLITAMDADYGSDYGSAYFTQHNTAVLLELVRSLSEQSATATVFNLAGFLKDPANGRLFKDEATLASELRRPQS
ncbi:MAG TPA: hypothetical protein VE988_00490 [Gemmataceae bacterium]|nr:hypothetical protein [Gemmataceae bacterium]